MSNTDLEIDTRLKVWGNSYGIVVPKALAERLGLEPGMAVHVTIEQADRNDASKLPAWSFPYRPTKEILDEGDVDEDLHRPSPGADETPRAADERPDGAA